MEPATVICMLVGHYKDQYFLEFDCPICGATHTIIVRDIATQFEMHCPCVRGSAAFIVSGILEDDSYTTPIPNRDSHE